MWKRHSTLKVVLVVCLLSVLAQNKPSCIRGVNLSGLEFGGAIPGRFQKDYTVPTSAEVDYFVAKGLNLFRLPFRWERLQETPNTPLNVTYLGIIDGFVEYATGKGAHVLLDVHNYARYFNNVIGGPQVPASQFGDLWARLATHYKGNSKVIFGIMNEPHGMQTELWLADANTAIAAIRSTGATNLITVPGNGWTGAGSWFSTDYGTPNAVVMLGVKDPINNFIFEVHQYLDKDSSGTHPECVNATIGSVRLERFTAWCKQHGYQAMVGEWAGAVNPTCESGVSDMARYMAKNNDVYLGWTWWSAGPWWGKYMFNLDEDQCGKDAPQLQYLTPSLCPKSEMMI